VKVAYIHTGLWPSKSPSMTFASMTVKALSDQVEECHFFIRRNSKKKSNIIFNEYFDINKPDNLFVHQIEGIHIIRTNKLFFRKVDKAIKKLLTENNLDLIISRSTTFLPYLAEYSKKYNVPSYYESHDFFADLSIRDDVRNKLKQSKLENKYIPLISGIICLQENQKKIYTNQFSGKNIFVARTGIHQIKKNKESKRKYLGYIGSLDKHKGVNNIIKAAALSESKPEILIVGGKTQDEINAFFSSCKDQYSHDKIKITGWLKKNELQKFLGEIKVGVLPLLDTFFNRYITSPLKLFDYYSYGIPVIASDLPTMRELIDENVSGLFYNANDVEQLARNIDLLFNDENKYYYMSQNVYEKAETLLWKNRVETILSEIGRSNEE